MSGFNLHWLIAWRIRGAVGLISDGVWGDFKAHVVS